MASSQTPPSTSHLLHRHAKPHSPWRRSACDRCRGQKLCCTRKVDDPTGSCIRCTRMRLVCNTSPPKTVGRPPRKTSSASERHQRRPENNNNKTSEKTANPPTVIDNLVAPSAVDNGPVRTAQNSASSPLYLSWPFPQWHLPPHDAQSVEVDEDASMLFPLDSTSYPNMLDTGMDTGDLLPSSSLHSLSPDNMLPTPTPSLRPFDLSSEMSPGLFSSPGAQDMLVHPPSIEAQSEGTSHVDAVETDPGVLLATLQQSLSKQLVSLKSTNWDSTDLSITTGTSTDARPDGSFHPLASILESTTQLLTILRQLKSCPRSASGSVPSPPPIVHVVTVINCYLLAISIFDSIFRHILVKPGDIDQRLEDPSASSSSTSSSSAIPSTHHGSSQRAPEVLFVPLTSRLRTRLLVQVVEHQLELLERALGLPPTDCVSTGVREDVGCRNAEEGGNLDWRETRILFRAIVEADDPGWRGGDGFMSRAVASLRENLRIAQRATRKDMD